MSDIELRVKHTQVAPDLHGGGATLSRRDWILLPMLSLLTILLMVISTKWLAGRMFHTSTSTTSGCLILNDPSTGVRAIPHTVCSEKAYESELVEYRFNNRGHRAGIEYGPKLPGTYRIVMVGSSFNYGMFVSREKSFAALLPEELTKKTGRRVELYNEAMQWGFPASAALRFHQALEAQPDMILWVLTPTDIASSSVLLPYVGPPNSVHEESSLAKKMHRIKVAFATTSVPMAIESVWNDEIATSWNRRIDSLREAPSGFLLQHILYVSQSLYVKSYLTGNDSEEGFLSAVPSAEWRSNLRQFDIDAAQIEGQAKAAGVPFVAVLVPNRAQAAMISMGEWPAGLDPGKLDEEVRSIITNHGGTYIDVLPDFRSIPNPERHYFPVDGHPDAGGHAMISEMLAKELTGGAVPALNRTLTTQVSLGESR
jgi:hypothetical protein